MICGKFREEKGKDIWVNFGAICARAGAVEGAELKRVDLVSC